MLAASIVASGGLRPAPQAPDGRTPAQLPPAAAHAIDFARDVKPILQVSCVRCHARGRDRGGFSIERRERLLAGGDSGEAVVPGDSAHSRLIALVALAAAVALASDSNGNRTFTLTGTQALNAREIAAKVSAATDKPLTVVDVTAEQLADGLRAHGFPPALADVFTSFDVATAAGDLAEVTDDFATLTGRAPSTFDAWLPANLALLTKAH